MRDYIDELRSVVERSTPALLALSEDASAQYPAPGKWSPREVLGHLIDSASNNHQRFVRAQVQGGLVFSGYDQDAWVTVQQYQHAPWTELVTLWRAFNLHLARVMAAVPEPVRMRGASAAQPRRDRLADGPGRGTGHVGLLHERLRPSPGAPPAPDTRSPDLIRLFTTRGLSPAVSVGIGSRLPRRASLHDHARRHRADLGMGRGVATG